MAFKIVGTLHIIVVGEKDPTREDWTTYIHTLMAEERRGTDITQIHTLVFSDGGGPNAAQRKVLGDVLNGRATPLAIVTGNVVMRGLITALRWFNPMCRAFPPDSVGEALKYLEIPQGKYDAIMKVARDLQKQLGLLSVKSIEGARLSSLYISQHAGP